MKIKQQRQLCSFLELEEGDLLSEQFERYSPLLKNSLVQLQNGDDEDIAFLKERDICIIDAGCKAVKRDKAIEIDDSQGIEAPKATDEPHNSSNEALTNAQNVTPLAAEVIENTVRSGVVIKTEADLLVLARVNSGATIETTGAFTCYGIIDGQIRCDGAYALIKSIGSGNLFFHALPVEKEACFNSMTLVRYAEGKLQYKELV